MRTVTRALFLVLFVVVALLACTFPALAITPLPPGAIPIWFACNSANSPTGTLELTPEKCFTGPGGLLGLAVPYTVPFGQRLCLTDFMMAGKFAGDPSSYMETSVIRISAHSPQEHPELPIVMESGEVYRISIVNLHEPNNIQTRTHGYLVPSYQSCIAPAGTALLPPDAQLKYIRCDVIIPPVPPGGSSNVDLASLPVMSGDAFTRVHTDNPVRTRGLAGVGGGSQGSPPSPPPPPVTPPPPPPPSTMTYPDTPPWNGVYRCTDRFPYAPPAGKIFCITSFRLVNDMRVSPPGDRAGMYAVTNALTVTPQGNIRMNRPIPFTLLTAVLGNSHPTVSQAAQFSVGGYETGSGGCA